MNSLPDGGCTGATGWEHQQHKYARRLAASGLSAYRQSAIGTLSRFCTHSLVERQVVLPAVRSCKEAFPDGKARKSPRMSPISDLKSEGVRALQHLPGFVDGLTARRLAASELSHYSALSARIRFCSRMKPRFPSASISHQPFPLVRTVTRVPVGRSKSLGT